MERYFGSGWFDHVSSGRTDTGIPDTKEFVFLVGTDTDVKLLLGVENRAIGQECVTDFVESIRTVRINHCKNRVEMGPRRCLLITMKLQEVYVAQVRSVSENGTGVG